MIDEYFKVRKPIHDYMTATIEKAKTDGYVETYFGRRRPTPDVRSSNFMVRAGAERAAANMPINMCYNCNEHSPGFILFPKIVIHPLLNFFPLCGVFSNSLPY